MVGDQLKHLLAKMDLVSREEFDVVKAMAEKARAENEALKARIEALEASDTSAKPTTAKKAAKVK